MFYIYGRFMQPSTIYDRSFFCENRFSHQPFRFRPLTILIKKFCYTFLTSLRVLLITSIFTNATIYCYITNHYLCNHLSTTQTYHQCNTRLIRLSTFILSENCPNSELFWTAFPRIWTEYGVNLHIKSACGKIRTRKTPNIDSFHAV